MNNANILKQTKKKRPPQGPPISIMVVMVVSSVMAMPPILVDAQLDGRSIAITIVTAPVAMMMVAMPMAATVQTPTIVIAVANLVRCTIRGHGAR